MSLEPHPSFQADSRELVLASSSPRRRELLERFGYRFRVLEPDSHAECGICSRETPPEVVARLAYQKAANVIDKIDSGLVLACDTVAECVAIILGKPEDREHARQMLTRLRGRSHSVYSGICLWDKVSAHRLVRVDVSHLWMEPISDQQLDAYLDSEQWVGKAGAFGFQDGPNWIRLDRGSASNVVGLPMELLGEMLVDMSKYLAANSID
ncbi:MAG: Maf family protein [Planctomycetota bacterium]|nr:Maf family protein [Planctomycetota bacterium]